MTWHIEEQSEGLRLSFKITKKIKSKKSKYQQIDIVDTLSHGRVMSLDKKIMVTEKDEFVYHEMLSHIPLFSYTKLAKRVLIIGGGDGGTVRECLKHTYIDSIDLCEIDGDVVELSKQYMPFTANCLSNKKVNIYIEDGFKFLKEKDRKNSYDIILVDSTDPIGAAAVLFKKSFFTLIKNCLKPGGIMCTQCESPFFLAETITKATKDLSTIFSNVDHFTAPVTTYPSGYWSFIIASDNAINFNKSTFAKLNLAQKDTRFWNQEVHQAAFAIPNFFKDLIKKKR